MGNRSSPTEETDTNSATITQTPGIIRVMSGNVFVIIRTHGPAFVESIPLESQKLWKEHANFMDALHEKGFAILVGPLEGTSNAMIICRAASASEIESALAKDPWTASGHLYTSQIAPWTLRLGSLPEQS